MLNRYGKSDGTLRGRIFSKCREKERVTNRILWPENQLTTFIANLVTYLCRNYGSIRSFFGTKINKIKFSLHLKSDGSARKFVRVREQNLNGTVRKCVTPRSFFLILTDFWYVLLPIPACHLLCDTSLEHNPLNRKELWGQSLEYVFRHILS